MYIYIYKDVYIYICIWDPFIRVGRREFSRHCYIETPTNHMLVFVQLPQLLIPRARITPSLRGVWGPPPLCTGTIASLIDDTLVSF